jgi:hypothetical protein
MKIFSIKHSVLFFVEIWEWVSLTLMCPSLQFHKENFFTFLVKKASKFSFLRKKSAIFSPKILDMLLTQNTSFCSP